MESSIHTIWALTSLALSALISFAWVIVQKEKISVVAKDEKIHSDVERLKEKLHKHEDDMELTSRLIAKGTQRQDNHNAHIEEEIKRLSLETRALEDALNQEKEKNRDLLEKTSQQAEETQKMLSNSNIGVALGRRR